VDAAQAGHRLDRVLASTLGDLSRARIQQLLSEGHITRDGATIKDANHRVKGGDVFEVFVPPAAEARPRGQDIPLDVVYEDKDLIVIEKPAGLVVHPAAGNPDGTLVNALIAHCGASLMGIGGEARPGIVHRLDKDTSGLLVAARTPGAEPFVRFLPGCLDAGEAARESRTSLAEAGFDGPVRRLGEHQELAGLLARCPTVTRLASPRSERRRASLAWAHRATRAALVVALLGVLVMAAGLRLSWRNRALHSQAAAEARLVGKLRETGALAAEAKRLQAELVGRSAPWPRVAETVATLARQLPPETGWERFEIKDGALEIEAAATGTAARARLDLLRHTLERTPGLLNLSWDAPSAPPNSPRLRQVFRATLGAP